MADPLQKIKPPVRHAPGANTIADFLIPPPSETRKNRERNQDLAKLAIYAGNQSERARQGVEDLLKAYLYPYPPGGGPPGAGAPQKKLIEDLGGLLAPKVYFKALTEIGEGQIPLVKRVDGPGFGLGIGEEEEIRKQTERYIAARDAYYDALRTTYYLGRAGAIATGAPLGLIPGLPGRVLPLENPPVNNLIAEAWSRAREPIKHIASERGDP